MFPGVVSCGAAELREELAQSKALGEVRGERAARLLAQPAAPHELTPSGAGYERAYSSAARDSNSKPTNVCSPTTQAS